MATSGNEFLVDRTQEVGGSSPPSSIRKGLLNAGLFSPLSHLLATTSDLVRFGLVAALFTAANLTYSWLPSQNGFVLEWPQRQRTIASSTGYGLPSPSRSATPPWMR